MVEEGGFLYDADAYDDDLPYWTQVAGTRHLVVPYTLDNNDMRFALPGGLATGDEWLAYVRDAFDVLYAEGADHPKMMSVGLHMRLMGRPGRAAAQAASGMASVQSSVVGEPRYVPAIVADKTSSLTVLAAVLAALHDKARTGEGQEVEVPMFESMAAWVMLEHLYGETFVPPDTDQNRRDFFAIAGRPDLADDPRFKTLGTRLAHIEFLYKELGKIATHRPASRGHRVLAARLVHSNVRLSGGLW